MKKHSIYLVLFFIIMILTACDDLHTLDIDNEIQVTQEFSYNHIDDAPLNVQSNLAKASRLVVDNNYLYFKDKKSFVKYNLTTGIKTYLCNDPVCTHIDTDCPLYGYTDFCALPLFYGDKLYYFVDYDEVIYKNGIFDHVEKINNLSCYDFITQTYHVIKDNFYVNILEYLIYDNIFYYQCQYQDEDGNYIYYLNSLDLDTSTVYEKQMLCDIDGANPYNLLTAKDGQIYFASYLSGELFSCDSKDFSSKTVLYTAPDGYNITHIGYSDTIFYFIIQNSDCSDQILCSYNLLTQQETILYSFPQKLYYLYYTESYVYYMYDEYKSIGTTIDSQETIMLPSSRIYRLDYRSTSPAEEFVFEFKDEPELYSISDFVVSGNYIYAYYILYPVTENIYSYDGYNSIDDRIIIRIDIETGDIYYLQ